MRVLFFIFLAVSIAVPTNAQATGTPKETPKEKFERDVQSLFGASVKTNFGQMNVRQRRDQAGRVRKQIVVGPGFSEIQVDSDADGTIDFWEVSRGKKTVSVSHPNRGRFLRLEVSERFAQGLQNSTYLLDLNGRSYNLLKTEFTGSGVVYRSTGAPGFEPDEGSPPETISASITPSVAPIDSGSRVELSDQDLSQWKEYQSKILDEALLCENDNSAMNRLASFQRDWWKILKFEVKENTDQLVKKIKDSPMFHSSCKAPERSKDYEALVRGLADVMLQSSKGQPMPSNKSRGRHLRCLENSGLGVSAARIEREFMKSIQGVSDAPIRCDWKEGPEGLSMPATTSYSDAQITVHMCLAQNGKGMNLDRAVNNYQNVLLHELLHVSGIRDEVVAHAAQACCGDPSENRVKACAKLDEIVGSKLRLEQIETYLSRVSSEAVPMVALLKRTFGNEDADRLYEKILLGLDKYDTKNYPEGFLSDAEFTKCVRSSSVDVCRAQWKSEIEKFITNFFAKDCQKLVLGENRRNCKAVAKSKEQISEGADMLARALIDDPSRTAAAVETPGSQNSDGSGGSAPPSCTPAGTTSILKKVGFLRQSPAVRNFSAWVFGRDVVAETVTDPCGPQVGLPTPDPSEASGWTQGHPGDMNIKSPSPIIGREIDSVTQSGQTPNSEVTAPSRGSDRATSNSSLAVSPLESDRSRSSLETRYRRATDFVGRASSGLEKIRDRVLPKAIAENQRGGDSGGTSKSTVRRLGPKDSFVAFTADRAEKIAVGKIDNPFALARMPASAAAATSGASQGSSLSASGSVGGSTRAGGVSPGGAVAKGGEGPAGAGAQKAASRAATVSSTRTRSESGGGFSSNSSSKLGGNTRGDKDLLGDLFSRPYQQIEARLKRLETVEALVERRISVQDATGRILGSTRPVDRYVYAGAKVPLKRLKDHE